MSPLFLVETFRECGCQVLLFFCFCSINTEKKFFFFFFKVGNFSLGLRSISLFCYLVLGCDSLTPYFSGVSEFEPCTWKFLSGFSIYIFFFCWHLVSGWFSPTPCYLGVGESEPCGWVLYAHRYLCIVFYFGSINVFTF